MAKTTKTTKKPIGEGKTKGPKPQTSKTKPPKR